MTQTVSRAGGVNQQVHVHRSQQEERHCGNAAYPAQPLLDGPVQPPGGQHGDYSPSPGPLIIPPVIENQQIQPPEDGQQARDVVGQLPEVFPEQPAAVLAEDGHRRADAGGLLHKGNIVAVIKTILRQPLLIADPILLQLRHDVAVEIDVSGDGLSHRRIAIGIGQLLPDIPQVLRTGEAEEHQQQGGQNFHLKPDLTRPSGQGHVRPLFVLPQQEVHQEQSRAYARADGVAENFLPVGSQVTLQVVQLVVLV